MIFIMEPLFDLDRGRYSIISYLDWQALVMEREWVHNKRNISCVLRDSYLLEPHSTEKYPNTFALVGATVSHQEEAGVPRFACCLHEAVFPLSLEGCLTLALRLGAHGQALGTREAMEQFREITKGVEEIELFMTGGN